MASRTGGALRLPLLLEVVARYRHDISPATADPGDAVAMIRSGQGTNDLIISGYRLASGRERKQLRMEPNEQQSLAILRTAHHFCGHGEDTAPPLRFALRHFLAKPYSADSFEALRAYRAVLAQVSAHTAVQRLRGEIDFDPLAGSGQPSTGVLDLPVPQPCPNVLRNREGPMAPALARLLLLSATPSPAAMEDREAVNAIGRKRAMQFLLDSTCEPTMPVELRITTACSAALENIVWIPTALDSPPLDNALHEVLFLAWKSTQPLDKVAAAMCHLWNERKNRSDREQKLHAIRMSFRA